MSIKIMTAVWDFNECSNHTEKLVLLALADNANDEGVCWPSMSTLARKCSLTRQGVLNKINSLKQKQLVSSDQNTGRSNTYTVKIPGDPPANAIGGGCKRRLQGVQTPLGGGANAIGPNHKQPALNHQGTASVADGDDLFCPICSPEANAAPVKEPLKLPPEAQLWNKVCGSISKVLCVSSSRAAHLKARRADPFWVQNYEAALRKVAASCFCQGMNDRGWKATFDWLVGRPDALAKVMEGKYDNRVPVKPPFDLSDPTGPKTFKRYA